MKTHAKKIAALASGAMMISGLSVQTAQANPLDESGVSILADAYGVSTGPEALTVNWSVVENASDIYTYTYTVNNPVGDVLLDSSGNPTTTVEIVDAYSVSFNATVPGAYVPFSQIGGLSDQDNGTSGLFWSFGAVSPGASSPALSFESDLPPALGNANAQDANPPSPWSSIPGGQEVPVPRTFTSVPDANNTMCLLAGVLVFLPIGSKMRVKAGPAK